MPHTPKISIIVPVYNSGEYLDRCLGSIANQTFTDFEVIMVDDGSTDGSGSIIDNWHENDSRFIALHQPSAGVSAARNAGLDNARGEWITFVDSDDYIFPTYLSDLYDSAIGDNSDIVVSGCKYEINGKEEFRRYARAVLSGDTLVDAFRIHQIHKASCVWGKLFRASLIDKDVRFIESISWGEDIIFSWRFYAKAVTISLIDTVNYHYSISEDSLCHKSYAFDTEHKCFKQFKQTYADLGSRFGKSLSKADFYIPHCFKRTVRSIYRTKLSHRERINFLKSIDFEYSDIYTPPTNIKERIYLLALRFRLWRLVDRINTSNR